MSLPEAIQRAIGVPASIRVGTVTSTSPLRVQVQDTVYQELGYIGTLPSLGDTVALIGQSTSVTSSPSSWLVLGKINPGG